MQDEDRNDEDPSQRTLEVVSKEEVDEAIEEAIEAIETAVASSFDYEHISAERKSHDVPMPKGIREFIRSYANAWAAKNCFKCSSCCDLGFRVNRRCKIPCTKCDGRTWWVDYDKREMHRCKSCSETGLSKKYKGEVEACHDCSDLTDFEAAVVSLAHGVEYREIEVLDGDGDVDRIVCAVTRIGHEACVRGETERQHAARKAARKRASEKARGKKRKKKKKKKTRSF